MRLAEEARKYSAEMGRKNKELREAISDKFCHRLRNGLREKDPPPFQSVEVIDIGRSPDEEFFVLHPSLWIGRKSGGSKYYLRRDDCLLKKLRKLASKVKDFNQMKTDIQIKQSSYDFESDLIVMMEDMQY